LKSRTNSRRTWEITAVAITGIGKLIFMDYLQWIVPYLSVAIIGWTSYIYFRNKADNNLLYQWGFRTDNFYKVFKKLLPLGLIAVVTFIVWGYFNNTLNITWHIIPIFILYPIWGTIQQFLIMSLFAGNLKDHTTWQWSDGLTIAVTATLFALIHFPYYWLIGGTFFLALIYTFIFLKERNLYVLGLFHGWLGAVFYYTVMTRDPWIEMLKSLGLHL